MSPHGDKYLLELRTAKRGFPPDRLRRGESRCYRSAIRNMERAGIPRKEAMTVSGNKTEAAYRRYDIVSPQDLRIAAVRMETYLGSLRAAGNNPVATDPRQKEGEPPTFPVMPTFTADGETAFGSHS